MAEAKKVPVEDYTVQLTLSQQEAEDLRGLLYQHVAGPFTYGSGTLSSIQNTLRGIGVRATKFNLKRDTGVPAWVSLDSRNGYANES